MPAYCRKRLELPPKESEFLLDARVGKPSQRKAWLQEMHDELLGDGPKPKVPLDTLAKEFRWQLTRAPNRVPYVCMPALAYLIAGHSAPFREENAQYLTESPDTNTEGTLDDWPVAGLFFHLRPCSWRHFLPASMRKSKYRGTSEDSDDIASNIEKIREELEQA